MPLKAMPFVGWITRTIVFGGAIVASLLIAGAIAASRPEPEISDTAGLPPVVDTIVARPTEVRRQWNGFGTADALNNADIPARVTAVVIDIPNDIRDGDRVEANQILVQLDDSDFLHQVEIAAQSIADIDAQLSQLSLDAVTLDEQLALAMENFQIASTDLERLQDAAARGAAQPRELDQSRQSLINARREVLSLRQTIDRIQPQRASLQARRLARSAERDTALNNVERCSIRSPIGGIVQFIDVEVGESLMIGQRVARVVDLHVIEVPILLPSHARSAVNVGDEVTLKSAQNPPTIWNAQVVRVAPEDDEATRTMRVYVEVEQSGETERNAILAPGRFVAAAVQSGLSEERVVVPRRCIKDGKVKIVVDGEVALRSIVPAFHIEQSFDQFHVPDTQWVVVESGINTGDTIILDVNRLLPIGTKVNMRTSDSKDGLE